MKSLFNAEYLKAIYNCIGKNVNNAAITITFTDLYTSVNHHIKENCTALDPIVDTISPKVIV